jgi:hypothetical protein
MCLVIVSMHDGACSIGHLITWMNTHQIGGAMQGALWRSP